MPSPEELVREKIDNLLSECGWTIQNRRSINDRGNLGDQTLKEFQQFVTPGDGRKFTELYNVQHLQSVQLDRVSRVCISTIQRLYSMLRTLFFWIETLMPQGQFTRGDRLHLVRVQGSVWNAVG